MILIGVTETDSSFPKDTHLLVCTQFLAEKGFISHEDLKSYRVLGGICQGHVDMKWCPGVDFQWEALGWVFPLEWVVHWQDDSMGVKGEHS